MSYLELTDIHKRFGETVAVEDFNLTAEKGEFVSFLGPSGCGKTTTLRMIAGFEVPTAGTIRINGEDVTYRPPNRRNVGMVFQSYALFPNMTVADNIGFGLKVRKRSKDDIRKRVGELLEIVNLPEKGARYPYQLSGGQQQRVALARALAFEPQVLLLDEPLSALDAKIRVALRHEIRQIQRQLGITTVYVTHDQEEALSLSDRVVVMSEGRMEQVGTPFEVYNFPTTAFVASFVGTLNVLPAVVVDAGRGELTIEGQPVRLTSGFEGVSGREVRMALRPEMVSLGRRPEECNNLTGKVTDVSFLGSIVRIRVGLANGAGGDGSTVVLDEFNEPTLQLPNLGDTVTLSFPLDGPLVLDAKAPLDSVEALIAEAGARARRAAASPSRSTRSTGST
jgi:putative spermidine/putrescine transport system ATP-binding protein